MSTDKRTNYDSPPIFGEINMNLSLVDLVAKDQHSASIHDEVEVNYANICRSNGKKHEMSLDLSLSSSKSDNLFGPTDLTPTPTRFIKNCEDLQLFEDLRHVNPFDEGFRRAVEQNAIPKQATSSSQQQQSNDGESLHTPQVYPLDATVGSEYCGNLTAKTVENALDVIPIVSETIESSNTTAVLDNGHTIDAPVAINAMENNTNKATTATEITPMIIQSTNATPIQILQPQITWVIPAQVQAMPLTDVARNTCTAIPVQTVRPFILPKTNVPTKSSTSNLTIRQPANERTISTINIPTTMSPVTPHEPSSASLTPTSQLPIKERLKAILNSNNKNRINSFEQTTKIDIKTKITKSTHNHKTLRDADCMERRRAAATRYRNKMRKEHSELRQRNSELQTENKNLRQRIRQLEQELSKKNDSSNAYNASGTSQIQIPPSSIHLVINVPKMTLPTADQITAPLIQQPITYRLEKK